MARRSRSDIPKTLDFEKMIDEGENPKGFTAQTANGTAHWKGTGGTRTSRLTREQSNRRRHGRPDGRIEPGSDVLPAL